MSNVMPVIEQILMLLVITAIGYVTRRRKIMTDGVIKGVNSLLLRVAWPCMILMTIQKDCTEEQAGSFWIVLGVSCAVLSAAMGALYLVGIGRGKKSSVFNVLSVLPNAGFVGMPIIKAVYGDEGILFLAAFLVGFNLVLWTLGVALFEKITVRSLHNLLNPGLIASVAGMILFIFRIRLPHFLSSTVTQLGSLTTPVSMLLLGARLDQITKEKLLCTKLWASCALKLLVFPLLTLLLMRLLGIEPVLTGITVLAMAMPSASVAQLLAEKYEDDIGLAVAGVSASMMICILTIPLVLICVG